MNHDTRFQLSRDQRLLLHQLRTIDAYGQSLKTSAENGDDEAVVPKLEVGDQWALTRGVTLYPWQEKCIESWFGNGHRGTVKVVTGGGKTLLALAIAERLHNTEDPDLRVAVVVPTIVLMHQWYDELIERGNLPPDTIGRLGGGYRDDFGDERPVLIAVLVSASDKLAGIVDAARCGDHLLLVADECHRAGAAKMSRVFETKRAYNLGLSATPERDEDDDDDTDTEYGQSVTGKELGRIIYEFTLADALTLGIIPKFTIHHYGLPLTPEERHRYEQLSRIISDDRNNLRALAPGRGTGPGFFGWTRKVMSRGGELSGLAARFHANIERRKALIHAMGSRTEAVRSLIREEFRVNPDARILLFHESIAQVMHLFVTLRDDGFPVVAEHSKLPDNIREEGLQLFRRGVAQVMVSAKSLIEGFNVPAVDVGIIVASSSSVRQRIQSLGRVLRRHRGKDGEEKTSAMHVLYGAETTDEMIYAKVDWAQTTGIENNLYYQWNVIESPILQSGPPRSPLPSEDDVDPSALATGEEYPGAYAGDEFTCDTQGNIRSHDELFYSDPGELVSDIRLAKGGLGRFRVTPKHRHVLVRVQEGDEWVTRYVRTLEKPLAPLAAHAASGDEIDESGLDAWASTAQTGDGYPVSTTPVQSQELSFSSKRGGTLVQKRGRGREVFARVGERATDPAKGEDARRLLDVLRELRQKGTRVRKLEVTPLGHAVFRLRGELKFLCSLEAGLEFPE